MPLWGDWSEPGFGLDDTKIAAWQSAGSWGTALDIPSVRVVDYSMEFQKAVLEGDDKITAIASRVIQGGLQMSFGGLSLAALNALATILNLTVVTGGAEGARYAVMRMKDITPGYIGLCGRALASDGSDAHLFLPKLMVNNLGGLKMEFGQFSLPEVTFDVLDDGTDSGLGEILLHEAAMGVTIPPVYT